MSPEVRERLWRLAELIGEPEILDSIPERYFDGGQVGMILDSMGGRVGTCRVEGCGRRVWWMRMRKSGKWNPYTDEVESHFSNCAGAEVMRRKKARA